MENYVFLKAKLLKNLSAAEYAVLNYDDEIVRSFAEKTKAQVLYFSVRERVKGAFYEQGDLYFGKEKIISASELPSEGLHNVQNALAVIVAAKIMGIKTADIVDALTNFKGIKHRIELVREVNGVQYINDSKGTNVDATLKAIATMKRETVLLLGGQNKGYDYGALFAGLQSSKVVHTVLYGENRFALLKSARAYDFNALTMCENFDFAVRVASMLVKKGQAVLLSPASASFDAFAGYEERGDRFVEIVNSFEEECANTAMEGEEEREERAEYPLCEEEIE
jgi:UDP-N-acetylmuramoylalanine--D-glutamate ligase